MGVALFEIAPTAVSLDNFNDTVVLRINLNGGTWALFGKVVIMNWDGDDQNAHVHLRSVAGAILDRTDVRIIEKSSESITVQGTVTVDRERHVEIVCATYNGNATQASLIAIEVDAAYSPQP